jgi:hypothetical protein
MTTNTCACGRPVTAGHTAGNDGTRCLLCVTALVMRTFRDPITARSQERTKREKAKR